MSMGSTFILILFVISINKWEPFSAEANVFMVLMDKDPVVSAKLKNVSMRNVEELTQLKESMRREHNFLVESILERGTYTKLYSYTHLLNGFAIHLTSHSQEAIDTLQHALGVRAIYKDIKLEKMTSHTPDFLGISSRVWPKLGGVGNSGNGVVIGMIDTGIDPSHPSFATPASKKSKNGTTPRSGKFKGKCVAGEGFPKTACNGKIVGAQYFVQAAMAAAEFNITRDYASPFDADGHGSHTASVAAGNYHIPVMVNKFNYGNASGMAPGAIDPTHQSNENYIWSFTTVELIAVYKACFSFGGYMSDVVAAVDQAVEDGVDILSLSVGPSSVPSGASAFLNVLEIQLLYATKAGVVVVQSAGNGGPSSASMLSFSPWITSVAASNTDRNYSTTFKLGDGQNFTALGLTPPTVGDHFLPIAAAADVCERNITAGLLSVESCQNAEPFNRHLVRGKLIICTYNFDFDSDTASIGTVADTISQIGASGFIVTMDPDIGAEKIKDVTLSMKVPGVILNDREASSAVWKYYNSYTTRSASGRALTFLGTGRILDGRQAIYTGQAPIVASYSSRGPDVNNALLETADVLKPNIMAPGSSIWAAWSSTSAGDKYLTGQKFALLSGTSMATPHIAGIAALIKQKHPHWSPSSIISAIMTTATTTDRSGSPILAQVGDKLTRGTPFDFGAGLVNPSEAMDPGLVFDVDFNNYIQFLCAVPGVDDMSVRRAVGVGCSKKKVAWCSDLNLASVTVSNLVGSRTVSRRVTNVGSNDERYRAVVRSPLGVNVTVTPQAFKININHSRNLKFVLQATQARNGYSFGEILLQGSRNHTVRVPMAVYVSSYLGSKDV